MGLLAAGGAVFFIEEKKAWRERGKRGGVREFFFRSFLFCRLLVVVVDKAEKTPLSLYILTHTHLALRLLLCVRTHREQERLLLLLDHGGGGERERNEKKEGDEGKKKKRKGSEQRGDETAKK